LRENATALTKLGIMSKYGLGNEVNLTQMVWVWYLNHTNCIVMTTS